MCGHFLLSAFLHSVSGILVDGNLCSCWNAARTKREDQIFLITTWSHISSTSGQKRNRYRESYPG